MQVTDQQFRYTVTLTNPVCAPKSSANRPWSLRDRLDERDFTNLITAYHEGTTATSLTTPLLPPLSASRAH